MEKFIWAMFLPFGRNMWSDVPVPCWGTNDGSTPEKRKRLLGVCAADYLRFDEKAWRTVVDQTVAAGVNMIVMDVGEGLAYPSHPELWVKGSWASDRVRDEVRRCRSLGIEVIPKLNFSASHDTWLKEYHRMLSTPKYYQVCADVLKDAYEAFDRPRLIHLGYDEETAGHQKYYGYCAVRQGDLWWHDFLRLEGLVEKLGARPWIWSDYCWKHAEEFKQRMPKSVLQSNWYYDAVFPPRKLENAYQERWIGGYRTLTEGGFDQVPCGSICKSVESLPNTVRYCRDLIPPEHLKGFLMAPWKGAILPGCEPAYQCAADAVVAARKAYGA